MSDSSTPLSDDSICTDPPGSKLLATPRVQSSRGRDSLSTLHGGAAMEGILLPTRAWPSFELLGVLDFSTLAYYNLADFSISIGI